MMNLIWTIILIIQVVVLTGALTGYAYDIFWGKEK